MGNDKFIELCKRIIVDYFNEHVDTTNNTKISVDNTFIVW